jgi:hypothetical protein
MKTRDEVLDSYKSHLIRYLTSGEYNDFTNTFLFASENIKRGAVDANFDILPIIYIWEGKEKVITRNRTRTRELPIVVEGYVNPKAYQYESDSNCINAFIREVQEITNRFNDSNPKNPFVETQNDVFYIIGDITMMAAQIHLAVEYVTTY